MAGSAGQRRTHLPKGAPPQCTSNNAGLRPSPRSSAGSGVHRRRVLHRLPPPGPANPRTSAAFLESSMSSSGTPSLAWMACFSCASVAPLPTSMRSRPSLRSERAARKLWRRRWRRPAAAAQLLSARRRSPGPQPDDHGAACARPWPLLLPRVCAPLDRRSACTSRTWRLPLRRSPNVERATERSAAARGSGALHATRAAPWREGAASLPHP